MNLRDLILDRLETTISEFCKDTRVSRVTFYSIINDNHKPSRHIIVRICKYFDVDYHDYL